MRYLAGLILIALLLCSAGCGRKSEGIPTSLRRGERTHALSVGDKIVHDLTVKSVNPKGKVVATTKGTITAEVRDGFKHGPLPAGVAKTFHISEVLQIGSSAAGQIDWTGQDSDGNIYFLGRLDEGTEWTLVTDKKGKTSIPAVLEEDASWEYTAKLSNGKTETDTFEVVGVEKVKTPAGEFEAYKTKIETKSSDGRRASGYQWLRPDLPRPVKISLDAWNTRTPKRGKQHAEAVMKSYEFAKER